jgi:hypothetical protein
VASAQPGGTTKRHARETLRDELLADLRSALPVDIALIGLHGAMVAEGYDDCEGDVPDMGTKVLACRDGDAVPEDAGLPPNVAAEEAAGCADLKRASTRLGGARPGYSACTVCEVLTFSHGPGCCGRFTWCSRPSHS